MADIVLVAGLNELNVEMVPVAAQPLLPQLCYANMYGIRMPCYMPPDPPRLLGIHIPSVRSGGEFWLELDLYLPLNIVRPVPLYNLTAEDINFISTTSGSPSPALWYCLTITPFSRWYGQPAAQPPPHNSPDTRLVSVLYTAIIHPTWGAWPVDEATLYSEWRICRWIDPVLRDAPLGEWSMTYMYGTRDFVLPLDSPDNIYRTRGMLDYVREASGAPVFPWAVGWFPLRAEYIYRLPPARLIPPGTYPLELEIAMPPWPPGGPAPMVDFGTVGDLIVT